MANRPTLQTGNKLCGIPKRIVRTAASFLNSWDLLRHDMTGCCHLQSHPGRQISPCVGAPLGTAERRVWFLLSNSTEKYINAIYTCITPYECLYIYNLYIIIEWRRLSEAFGFDRFFWGLFLPTNRCFVLSVLIWSHHFEEILDFVL